MDKPILSKEKIKNNEEIFDILVKNINWVRNEENKRFIFVAYHEDEGFRCKENFQSLNVIKKLMENISDLFKKKSYGYIFKLL